MHVSLHRCKCRSPPLVPRVSRADTALRGTRSPRTFEGTPSVRISFQTLVTSRRATRAQSYQDGDVAMSPPRPHFMSPRPHSEGLVHSDADGVQNWP